MLGYNGGFFVKLKLSESLNLPVNKLQWVQICIHNCPQSILCVSCSLLDSHSPLFSLLFTDHNLAFLPKFLLSIASHFVNRYVVVMHIVTVLPRGLWL